jgi:hypothetical protein
VAFKGKEHIRSKVCVYDIPTEQASSFKYLGYNISYEKDTDISTKIINYNRAMGIINQIFKSSLAQKHTRIKVYKQDQFYLMEVKPGQFVEVIELELPPMK